MYCRHSGRFSLGGVLHGLIIGCASAVWIDFVFRRTGNHRFHWSAVVERPAAVLYLMVWFNHYGTWAFDNSNTATKGWVLWVVWIGEALIVIGCAAAAAVAVGLRKPFCEACGRWCRRAVRLVLNPVPDSQELKQRIEDKDLSSLEGWARRPRPAIISS